MAGDVSTIKLGDVIDYGAKNAASPEETAQAVKGWRDAQAGWLKEQNPGDEIYLEGLNYLDHESGQALGELRKQAIGQWGQTKFQELLPDAGHQKWFQQQMETAPPKPDELGLWLVPEGGDPERFLEAYRQFSSIAGNRAFMPAKVMDWQAINSNSGAELARWTGYETDKGTEIQVSIPGQKDTLLTIPRVTEDEYAGELIRAQNRLRELTEEEETSRMLDVSGPVSAFATGKRQQGVVERDRQDASRYLSELEQSPAAGRMRILQDRLKEAVKNSPLADTIGKDDLAGDFFGGLYTGLVNMRVAYNDTTGDVTERDQLRAHVADYQKEHPGSTRREFQGGFGNILKQGAAGLGSALPTIAASAAAAAATGGASVPVQLAGRALAMAPMAVQSYGGNLDAMLTDADNAEREGNMELAKQLRADARTAAALGAITDVGTELVFPEERLGLGAAARSGGRVARTVKGAVASGAQNFAEEGMAQAIQGGLIQPALQGREGTAGDILEAGAAGAIAGGPMGVVAGLRTPKAADETPISESPAIQAAEALSQNPDTTITAEALKKIAGDEVSEAPKEEAAPSPEIPAPELEQTEPLPVIPAEEQPIEPNEEKEDEPEQVARDEEAPIDAPAPTAEAGDSSEVSASPDSAPGPGGAPADPESTTPSIVPGVRYSTPEGDAAIEAAKQRMRDIVNTEYADPAKKADDIAAARDAIGEAVAKAHNEAIRQIKEKNAAIERRAQPPPEKQEEPSTLKTGDMVTFRVPYAGGAFDPKRDPVKNTKKEGGKIIRELPDGRLEIRANSGGYYQLRPEELTPYAKREAEVSSQPEALTPAAEAPAEQPSQKSLNKPSFIPTAARFAQFYVDYGIPGAIAIKNGREIMRAIEEKSWSDLLHPSNERSREIWKQWTGKTLPKGVAASKQAFQDFVNNLPPSEQPPAAGATSSRESVSEAQPSTTGDLYGDGEPQPVLQNPAADVGQVDVVENPPVSRKVKNESAGPKPDTGAPVTAPKTVSDFKKGDRVTIARSAVKSRNGQTGEVVRVMKGSQKVNVKMGDGKIVPFDPEALDTAEAPTGEQKTAPRAEKPIAKKPSKKEIEDTPFFWMPEDFSDEETQGAMHFSAGEKPGSPDDPKQHIHSAELNKPLNKHEYTPIELSGRSLEALQASARSFPGGIEARARPQSLAASVSAFEKATGLTIQFFDAKTEHGFINPGYPRIVFLNSQSEAPAIAVAGHEWAHAAAKDPAAAERVEAVAKAMDELLIPERAQEMMVRLKRVYPQASDEELKVEMFGNIVGDALALEPVWDSNLLMSDWEGVRELVLRLWEEVNPITPTALKNVSDAELAADFSLSDDDPADTQGAAIASASNGSLLHQSSAAPPIAPVKGVSQIIRDIAKGLKIPIRFGRLTTNKFAGYFKSLPNLIGSKKANDIIVVTHEAGHKLDDLFNIAANPAIAAELNKLGDPKTPGSRSSWTKSKTRKYKMGEGVAEFVRYWLTDPAHAASAAPDTQVYFESILDANPDFGETMRQAQRDIDAWKNAPSEARLASSVSVGGNPNKVRYGRSGLTRDLVDDLHVLEMVRNEAQKEGAKLRPSQDFYRNARLLRGSYGMAQSFIQNGVANFKTKAVTPGTSLEHALKPVAGRIEPFRLWMVAKRAQELHKQGKETGLDRKDVDAVAAKYDGDADFQKAFDDIKAWNDGLLQYAVDSGYVSEEAADAMREMHKDYVPFHRVFEIGAGENPEQASGGTGRGLNAGKVSSLKRLSGSSRDIVDPLETMVRNAYALITAAEKSNVSAQIGALARKPNMGKWVEEIATPKEAVKFQAESVKKQLEAAGADLSAVPDDLALTFFRSRSTAPYGENIIRVTSRGETKFYRLNSELYNAFHALDVADSNRLLQILASPAQLLRAGVTLDPAFSTANVIRDAFGSAVLNRYGMAPFEAALRGVWAMAKNPKLIAEWQAAGGDQSFESAFFDQKANAKYMRERITKDLTKAQRATVWLKSPLRLLRYISSIAESATRIGEYQKAFDEGKKSGLSDGDARRQAAFEARDRQDFAMGGAKTKLLRHAAAFWNAGLQGNVALAKAFRDRPLRTTLQGLMWITAPTLALMSINKDDEDYWDLPRWQRDVFWLIPYGKDENGHTKFIRMPKPFLLGTVFGALPERIMAAQRGNKKAWGDFAAPAAGQLLTIPTPTFALPLVEANIGDQGYSFFRGREIVPDALAELPDEFQANAQTSLTAKRIGGLFGISPMKVDHIVQGYTGGVGKQAVHNGIDRIISAITGEPQTAENTAPMARFFTAPAGISSQAVDNFYQEIEALRKLKAAENAPGGQRMESRAFGKLANMEKLARLMKDIRKDAKEESDPVKRQQHYLRIAELAKEGLE